MVIKLMRPGNLVSPHHQQMNARPPGPLINDTRCRVAQLQQYFRTDMYTAVLVCHGTPARCASRPSPPPPTEPPPPPPPPRSAPPPPTAVGETLISADTPSPSLLKHLMKGERGGAAEWQNCRRRLRSPWLLQPGQPPCSRAPSPPPGRHTAFNRHMIGTAGLKR